MIIIISILAFIIGLFIGFCYGIACWVKMVIRDKKFLWNGREYEVKWIDDVH